jgi:hypothetical protein
VESGLSKAKHARPRRGSLANHFLIAFFFRKYFNAFEFGIGRAGRPEKVARQVYHALTDKRPKTRYPASNFMMAPTWLAIRAKWLLPDRVFDKIVA